MEPLSLFELQEDVNCEFLLLQNPNKSTALGAASSRWLRKVGFHERKSIGILILDMGSQSSHPFDFALSKIPTSRAKDAREMGHPAAFQASLPDAVRFWGMLTRQWNWRAIVGRSSGTGGF
jgi:hypothetical protein